MKLSQPNSSEIMEAEVNLKIQLLVSHSQGCCCADPLIDLFKEKQLDLWDVVFGQMMNLGMYCNWFQ